MEDMKCYKEKSLGKIMGYKESMQKKWWWHTVSDSGKSGSNKES